MNKSKFYKYLAAAVGYIGVGIVIGYFLSNQANETPLWIGGGMLIIGALLIGMFISGHKPEPGSEQNHGNG